MPKRLHVCFGKNTNIWTMANTIHGEECVNLREVTLNNVTSVDLCCVQNTLCRCKHTIYCVTNIVRTRKRFY